MDEYFKKLNKIVYSDTLTTNISTRVILRNSIFKNSFVFYPYTIQSGERADNVAARYYNDPYREYIIYLANNIIDPYFEWPLDDYELSAYIIKKYGSLELAIKKVLFYRHNWIEHEEDILSISAYNALVPRLQKYFQPFYAGNFSLTHYVRHKVDYTVATNKIIVLTMNNNTNGFAKDDPVEIKYTVNSSGRGVVALIDSDNDQLYIQHVSGTFLPGELPITADSKLYNETDGFSRRILAAALVAENLTDEENVYYKAVTAYDLEVEKNEYNKTIRVLDSGLAPALSSELTQLIRG